MLQKLLTLCFAITGIATLAQQNTAYDWFYPADPRYPRFDGQQILQITPANIEALQHEDQQRDRFNENPWRFGEQHIVEWSLADSANVYHRNRAPIFADPKSNYATSVWRFAIAAPGATSLNVQFSQFKLHPKTVVMMRPGRNARAIGLTHRNNKVSGTLATDVYECDTLFFEFITPTWVWDENQFEIGSVTYGYRTPRDFMRDLGDAGFCQTNTVCPEADPWREQVRSVCMILVNGNAFCTGALINNTCEDQKPYILTANHCLDGNEANWVFRFNWESPTCTPTANGPINQSIAGALVRANNAVSDMALLELFDPIPDDYNPFFAGWDASATAPDSSATIHHPSGDIKKISIDSDPVVQSGWNGVQAWKVLDWEIGSTEPGSSGAPLFDPQGNIIGQLAGGLSDCGNPDEDYYGRFDVSWDQGGTATTQLENWLDGCSTGATQLAGFPPAPTLQLDGSAYALREVPEQVCGDSIRPEFVIRNAGLDTLTSATVEWQLDAGPINQLNWTGLLLSGEITTVTPGLQYVTQSAHTISCTVVSPNGGIDQDNSNDSRSVSFDADHSGNPVHLLLHTDDFGTETTWRLLDSAGAVLYQGGPYMNIAGGQWIEEDFCLPVGCYKFRIADDFGDGMAGIAAGGLSDGFYQISDKWGLLAESRETDFGFVEFGHLCVSNDCSTGLPTSDMNIQPVQCKGESSGEVSASANNGTPPYQYAWSDPQQQLGSVADELATGDYFVTVTDSLGCKYVGYAIVPEADTALSITYNTTSSTGNDNNGAIDLIVSGGAPPYSYLWNDTVYTEDRDSLMHGFYWVLVSDTLGCSDTAFITVDWTPGIFEVKQRLQLRLVPNPASAEVAISLDHREPKPTIIRLYDAVGRVVLQKRFQPSNAQVHLDVSALPVGVYWVVIQTGSQSGAERLVLMR